MESVFHGGEERAPGVEELGFVISHIFKGKGLNILAQYARCLG
jgi:hypothetical protein